MQWHWSETQPLYSPVLLTQQEAFLFKKHLRTLSKKHKVKKERKKGNAFQQIFLNKLKNSKGDSLGTFCVLPLLPAVSNRTGHLNTLLFNVKIHTQLETKRF